MAEVSNHLSLHFSVSIAQPNQGTCVFASSAQPFIWKSLDLNTHVHVEANINLTVNRQEETGNRILVNDNSLLETDTIQEQQQPQYMSQQKMGRC